MPRVSPLEVYRNLPGTNCGECGEGTCMAFASALIERSKSYEECKPLVSEEKYAEKLEKLIALVTPPVKEVVVGTGERACVLGGEEVMYRHELTFFNPTAVFIDVSDELSEEEIASRVKAVEEFSLERMGQVLRLQGVAIRAKSGDDARFGSAVMVAAESTLPYMLCSPDPEMLEVGVEVAPERRPLLYAATEGNVKQVAELASRYSLPVVASAASPEKLLELVAELRSAGVEDIVLDPGTAPPGKGLGKCLENMVILRRLAVERGERLAGYPIMGTPMVAWLGEEDSVRAAVRECIIASAQLLRYADLLVMHSLEMFSLLPLLTLRQNIYTDPRVPIQVDAKLYEIGKPDENSPVLLTTNFALTYYTVASDIEAGKVNCYLLVVDTEGLAVEPAMAGAKLTGSVVKEALQNSGVDRKVKHRKLIIPGMAARISGEIEDATGWKVIVGPVDSSRIPAFIQEKWSPNGHRE
ncbi:MAG: acetyl-CoA decarbonylase/synthase complex subunit gamma [Euryarchaeota archaeon]|nr:acetyl-CoA decarbonylase/synthase complex subunit gamma [Euryarchaeota archaeon]